MSDCHKCKYETSAECVPRSQKMGFPKCYHCPVMECVDACEVSWLDWLKQEVGDNSTT